MPPKVSPASPAVKDSRCRSFDELAKLALAVAPASLADWVEQAAAVASSAEEAQRRTASGAAPAHMTNGKSRETSADGGVESSEVGAQGSRSTPTDDLPKQAHEGGGDGGGGGAAGGGGGDGGMAGRSASAGSDGNGLARSSGDDGGGDEEEEGDDVWAKRLTALVENSSANDVFGDGKDVARLQARVTQLENACRAAARDLSASHHRQDTREGLFRRLQAASDLRVSIEDAEVEFDEDLRDRHVKYRIVIRSHSDPSLGRTVRRRFSEFLQLHSKLLTTLDLPPRSYFMKTGRAFLDGRRLALETWLQRVVSLYSVPRVPALRAFLSLDDSLALVLPSAPQPNGDGHPHVSGSSNPNSAASSVATDDYSFAPSFDGSSFVGGTLVSPRAPQALYGGGGGNGGGGGGGSSRVASQDGSVNSAATSNSLLVHRRSSLNRNALGN